MKSIAILLNVVLAFVSATGHAKPKIAILGLEVVDSGRIDSEATKIAQNIATELRNRATQENGLFTLASNSAQDLLELKLLYSCNDEALPCMTEIGKQLGADRLIYGKLKRQNSLYRISLTLLDTNQGTIIRSTRALLSPENLRASKLRGSASGLYAQVTGAPVSGTLSIKANIKQGTVYVDGAASAPLRDGIATITDLKPGVHTIGIGADGYIDREAVVSIQAGKNERIVFALQTNLESVVAVRERGETKSTTAWKFAFVGGILVTGGMAAGWTYNGLRVVGELNEAKELAWRALLNDNEQASVDFTQSLPQRVVPDSCAEARNYTGLKSAAHLQFDKTCDNGKKTARVTNLYIAGTALSVLATAYFGYQGWIANEPHTATGKAPKRHSSKKRSRMTVIPSLHPQLLGAGLNIEF